jgi:hypothetical protein
VLLLLAFAVPYIPVYVMSKLSLPWKGVLHEVTPTIITMGCISVVMWWLILLPFLGYGEFTNSKLEYKHWSSLAPLDFDLEENWYLLVYASVAAEENK